MQDIPLYPFQPAQDDAIPFEIISIEELPRFAKRPTPHRHAFYAIFWVTAGGGTHYLDFVGDEIRANSLHFVGPGQVHYWDIAKELKGVTVVFEASLFLGRRDYRLLDQINFFKTVNGLSALYPTQAEAVWFQQTIEQLTREFTQKAFGRSLNIVALLELLLVNAQRLAVKINEIDDKPSAEKQLTHNYIHLVEKEAISHHKVEWYAEQLAVTVSHLSKCIKKSLGITAGELLRNRLVLEAKRLLIHTDQTVAEIATQLNFKDVSYFGRFFKREADQTPRQFRTRFPE